MNWILGLLYLEHVSAIWFHQHYLKIKAHYMKMKAYTIEQHTLR